MCLLLCSSSDPDRSRLWCLRGQWTYGSDNCCSGVEPYDPDAGSSGSFRLRRVLVWLQPEHYASGSGYQTLQGLYAIGSGGDFGKGLGNSAQKIESFRRIQNDMILSVICEELGVCGVIIVLVLFWTVIVPVDVYCTECTGYCTEHWLPVAFSPILRIQVILNIAVVTNTIPNTGVTLPFISYGGCVGSCSLTGGNGNCAQYIETDTCGRIVQKHSFQSLYNVLSYIKWFLILHIIEANDEHRRLREEMK